MALFAESDAWIKARLRLTSVPTDSEDTLAIVGDSIARARLTFYRRLGRSRVNALLAVAEVAAPDTNDEVLRSLASQVELKLVLVDLMRRLPNAFMDASGDLQRRWNEEAPFRERPASDREREVRRLLDEVEEEMQLLAASEESPGAETGVKAYDGTPTDESPLPGDSLLDLPTRLLAED